MWLWRRSQMWLWRRLVASAPIRPLAWEPPYAVGAAQENGKRTTTTTTKEIVDSSKSSNTVLALYKAMAFILEKVNSLEIKKHYLHELGIFFRM